jgi:hypothetical protein
MRCRERADLQRELQFRGRAPRSRLAGEGQGPSLLLRPRGSCAANTAEFCEKYDQRAFDPDYDTLPLEHFEPVVRAVFAEPREGFGFA